MDKNQLEHYLKGGMFSGIFNPKVLDIIEKDKKQIGKTMVFYQNVLISPILQTDRIGQFRFNSIELFGWVPEEDIENLTIIDKYKEHVEKLPVYIYALKYTDETKLLPNFGNNHNLKVPCIVYRECSVESDDYIQSLSKPQADEILKAIWNGEEVEKIKWTKIF